MSEITPLEQTSTMAWAVASASAELLYGSKPDRASAAWVWSAELSGSVFMSEDWPAGAVPVGDGWTLMSGLYTVFVM